MIVVDSSVWIDWFKDSETSGAAKLAACHADDILVGDIVLLEVLRGAADERHARGLEARLREYPVAPMLDGRLAARAAANYRRLRSLGITIRTTSDLVIGTFCIEHDHLLLQNDRDFLPMAEHLGLRLA
jgi:predicted nucleic acid-binding protein